MKYLKTAFALILCLLFTFALFSCGDEEECTAHIDEDGDLICDKCNENMAPSPDGGNGEDDIVLVKNGVANFQIVRDNSLPIDVIKAIDEFVEKLEDVGANVTLVSDRASGETETEILIGAIRNRDEKYRYDMYSLGVQGYAIKAIDSKIIITSGDYATLAETFEKFVEDHLGITDEATDAVLENVSVKKDLEDVKIQDNYGITDVLVNGKSLRGAVIALENDAAAEIKNSAKKLQSTFYERCGIYLPFVDPDNLSEDELKWGVIVRETENAGTGGFRIKVAENALIIETEFKNKIEDLIDTFITKEINSKKGEVKFSKTFSSTANVRNVYYNDFGAVGNGITDDFLAIKETHEYANTYGHTVCAGTENNSNFTYYLGDTGNTSIIIKTDTKWGNAKFTIDDSNILPTGKTYNTSLFIVESDYTSRRLNADELQAIVNENGGIDKTVTKLDLALGYPAMLTVYNNQHKVYIRYGANANSGDDQHELIIIDGEGNIDKDTPFLFDYDHVSSVNLYRIDDKQITLSGGHFNTIANRAPRAYTYYSRNITVSRSNVVIDGLVHSITGETETGAPYTGFINFRNANNLRVENTTLQAHKTYIATEGNGTSMGSYDISGGNANGYYFYNCTQSNFFVEGSTTEPSTGFWGIMGTNYCKNITYDNCCLSRLDAHAGVYNVTVKDSQIKMINLIGGGTATIKDSTVYNNTIVNLREDYGSLWDGDIIVENVDVRPSNVKNAIILIKATYYNHDFGYPIAFGRKITFKNISFPDLNASSIQINLFSNITGATCDFTKDRVIVAPKDDSDKDANGLYKNYNPITLPEEIRLIGFEPYMTKFKISAHSIVTEKYTDNIIFSED